MEKICIIGCGGAGKSTLARKLGAMLDIPVYHLDFYFWQPGWVEIDNSVFAEKQIKLMEGNRWILEGNFSSTFNVRFPEADTIIYLDFGRFVCLYNIFKRYMKYRGRTREDLPEGCNEKLDWQFTKWVWDYRKRTRPNTLRTLDLYQDKIDIIVLKSMSETDNFLQSVKANRIEDVISQAVNRDMQ